MPSRYRLLFTAALLAVACAAARARQEPPPAPPPPAAETPPDAPVPPPDTPVPPEGGEEERPRFTIGPEVGVFFPSSSKTRDAFGSQFTNIGVGLGAIRRRSERGAVALDISFISNRNKESNLFIVPVGLAYARSLGTDRRTLPYAGASVNAFLVNMRTEKGDYDVDSGIRSGLGGSLFAGVSFGGRVYVEGRYVAATKVSGFDLSGLNLSTGIRF